MKILIYTLLILFVSCLKLDDIAFQGKELNSYELDNYTGSKTIDNIPEEFAISSDKITFITTESKLQSEDNSKTIYSVYIGDISQISQDTIIIYCHGQSDHIDHYWPRAKLLANTGGKNRFGVIMMDYRGFGMSEGQSTEATMYEDVSSVI